MLEEWLITGLYFWCREFKPNYMYVFSSPWITYTVVPTLSNLAYLETPITLELKFTSFNVAQLFTVGFIELMLS